jgi:RNA polymerase sigma-70 factor (ECF subfamily)
VESSCVLPLGPGGAQERELISRAQRGDEAAFASIYEAHKRTVYALCLRMTRSSALAEDLTQDAFLQVFRKIATFRGESAFSTWLHRLVVNLVLMRLRRKAINEVSLDHPEMINDQPAKRDYGVEDLRLAGSIDRIGLERAMSQLPPGYRAVVFLHDVEGYEHSEIARMKCTSAGNSKSQLHKARLKLRKLLRLDQRKGRSRVGNVDPAEEKESKLDRIPRALKRLGRRNVAPWQFDQERNVPALLE